MGFGADLQGRTSHEALLKVQDTEIRLLETFKRFITSRIDADRQYATSLSKMLVIATKGEGSDFMEFRDCCSVFRAWDTILKETEVLIQTLKANSDLLATRTLDSLTFLINEKKNARRSYMDQRNNLDLQMTRNQEELQKTKTEYIRLMERLKVDRAKYQDIQAKGKAGAKLDDYKAKMVKTMHRLHQLHNDYVLAVHQANASQQSHKNSYLPSTLNCHQCVQELFVRHTKFVLADFHTLTDYASEQFQDISKCIKQDLDKIEPGKEYGSTFIAKYKSEGFEPLKFEFDGNILDDYSGPLRSSQLQLDDLTFEQLRHRSSRVEDDLKAEKKTLDLHQQEFEDLRKKAAILDRSLAEVLSPETLKEYVERKKQEELEKKEVEDSQATIKVLEELLLLVKKPLDDLGDASPPAAVDGMENGDASCDNESTISAGSRDREREKERKFKMPSLTGMSTLFKKGEKDKEKPNGKMRSSREDLLDVEEAEVRPPKDGGKARQGSYEQTEPQNLSPTSNGPLRSSMAAMREGGEIITDKLPAPKIKIEEEEWFHGVLPREEVQRLLVEDGNYLVRESKNRKTNETQYVLSVFWQGHKHFIIQGAEEVGWRFEGASFPTIQELIQAQYESGEPVTNKSQAILKKAILREDWELLNDHIHLEMKIGNGNFGEVYKGVYAPKNLVVAVKTCRDTLSEDQRKKFLQEGRILKQYNHPNIVSFIGIAAQRQPVMIVMEYVPGGALLSFLRKQGKQQSKRQLTQMCMDAASGMAYLEGRGCIHRDLAARNCLVGENNVIKISDFGMSREEEEYTVSEGMKQIPIKWTAPEALNFGKYTSLCDVWSYGILMWEIFSAGQQPYPGMTNAQARERIEEGYRLPANEKTPDQVYKIMLRCWEYNPDKRPHFQDIHDSLKDIVRKLRD